MVLEQKYIIGYKKEGYLLSANGEITGRGGKILKTHLHGKYHTVMLSKNGLRKRHNIHELIAKNFLNWNKKTSNQIEFLIDFNHYGKYEIRVPKRGDIVQTEDFDFELFTNEFG